MCLVLQALVLQVLVHLQEGHKHMITGTLFLPICNKPHIFPEWENTVRGLILPKDQMKVVLSDATGGSSLGRKAASIVKDLGFAKWHIERFKQKGTKKERNGWKAHLNIGERVGETFDRGLKYTEGSLLMILEDDIIALPDTFQILMERFIANDNIGFLSACTYKKKKGNTTEIIGWDKDGAIILDDNSPTFLKSKALATGCCITYGNLARHFDFKTSVIEINASPDIAYCRYLRNSFDLSVYINTDIKTKHVYFRDEGKQKVGELSCPEHTCNKIGYDYIPKSIKERTKYAPVFLVSCTGRAGSTFIQRLLSSSPEVMIWGEPHGAIAKILEFSIKMLENNRIGSVKTGLDQYKKYGHKGWLACIPPKKINLLNFERNQILNFYKGEKPIWGIKSINWSPKFITRMHRLFPDATFIFLHRNLTDVKNSFDKKAGWWIPGTFKHWINNYNRLMEYTKSLPENMHSIELDFDVVKNDLLGMCDMLEEKLLIDEGCLDRSILNDHISSWKDANDTYGKK